MISDIRDQKLFASSTWSITGFLISNSPGHYLCVCFIDFSEAFDCINHYVLISKLIELGVRGSLIAWIINFLSNRRQCFRLGELTLNWLPITARVNQEKKLGPILFLVMVKDLKTHQNVDKWKFMATYQ